MTEKDVKPISPEKFKGLEEQTKYDLDMIFKHLRSCKDQPFKQKRLVKAYLDYMYNQGIADAMGGEVVEEGRCINIDKGDKWQITCPYCGETYDIDMEAMLPKENDFKVRV